MVSSVEMRAECGKLIDDAENLIKRAETDQRMLTEDEQVQWDGLIERSRKLKSDAEQLERKEITQTLQAEMRSSIKTGPHIHIPSSSPRKQKMGNEEYTEIVRAWAMGGGNKSRYDADMIYRAKTVGIDLFSPDLELRTSSINTTTGAELIPTLLDSTLTEKLHFYSSVRKVARVFSTDSGAPIDHARYDYTAEATIVGEENDPGDATSPDFDKITTTPWHYATKVQKVSYEELQDANTDIVSLITDILGGEMARGQEQDFVFGNGTTAPQGLNNVAVGVTLDSSNTFNPDTMFDLEASVGVPYRAGAGYMMADGTKQRMRTGTDWKDDLNRSLWQPDLVSAAPNQFGEYAITLNSKMYSYAQAVALSGGHAPFIYFGNFKNYIIRDVGPSRVFTRYNELYARTGQVGFSLRMRTDGRMLGHSGSIVCARSH